VVARLDAASDNKLRALTVAGRQERVITESRHGAVGSPAWSPDGRWLAYSKPDATRTTDVYLAPSAGGEERRVTFESFNETSPRFSVDGRKLFFTRNESTTFGQGSGLPNVQLFSVVLERLERDPDDPEERAEAEAAEAQQAPPAPAGEGGAGAQGPGARRQTGGPRQPARPVNVDWAGLKRRTKQLTRMPFPVTSYNVSPDGRTLVFATLELAGQANVPAVYAVQDDGRRLTRVTASVSPVAAGGGDNPPPTPGGGGGGGGVSNLNVSRDGRTLFFLEGDFVYSVPMPSSAAAGPAASAAAPASSSMAAAPRRRVNFVAKVRVDRPAEWAQMFDDAWRTMKYRFYDPKMHGTDWDAMRAKYRPLVEYVGDRQELLNIVNEMIGELNASHTGAAPPPSGREPGSVSTGHLGLELSPDSSGRYRVSHVYEDGPADKDWVRVAAGDYLIAIDGKPVRSGEDYWPLLNHRLNKKVSVTFNNKPSEEGAWRTRIEPTTMANYGQLRYERWVKGRREMVDKLSGGRIGYLHIQAMNAPSLRRFEKELREFRNKEAMVIDQRWNGGGNIEQELLAILVQRQYQVWQPRGTEPTTRPLNGFFGPKVVLQNWRSGSNAEMFPAGFRALGLGKVIGTPTAGAVIGTGSYSLIDGSTVRTPATGVYLFDRTQTNLENYGVKPDILVENTPEDNLAGRDRQLETAVQELLKELKGNGRQVSGKVE